MLPLMAQMKELDFDRYVVEYSQDRRLQDADGDKFEEMKRIFRADTERISAGSRRGKRRKFAGCDLSD